MSKRKIEQQPQLKLYYFDIKGKGEPIRLFCAYAGLKLEDHRFAKRSDFEKMRDEGRLKFGQVPLLEIDGQYPIVQSSAILRYLAKISGLYPLDDHIQAAEIDAALDHETDAFTGTTVTTYSHRFGIPLDDVAKAQAYKALAKDVLPRHFLFIEKLLQESSTGWIAGTEEPSPADFVWYCRLAHFLPEHSKYFPKEFVALEAYPECKKLVEKMDTLEAVKEFYHKSS